MNMNRTNALYELGVVKILQQACVYGPKASNLEGSLYQLPA